MKEEKIITLEEKTFIERHAKKILLATGIAVSVGAYHMLKKHGIEIKCLKNENEVLSEQCDTLMAAASEGVFEDALFKVINKINYRKDKIEFMEKSLLNNPDDGQTIMAINNLKDELAILCERRNKFLNTQKVYEIANRE